MICEAKCIQNNETPCGCIAMGTVSTVFQSHSFIDGQSECDPLRLISSAPSFVSSSACVLQCIIGSSYTSLFFRRNHSPLKKRKKGKIRVCWQIKFNISHPQQVFLRNILRRMLKDRAQNDKVMHAQGPCVAGSGIFRPRKASAGK